MNATQTTEPEATDVTLHGFLSALYGATHDDFRLHHGDDTTDAGDDTLDAAVKAAGAEPIYVSLITANGDVPFLYNRLNYAAEDAWADFTDHQPTAALYRKDDLGNGTLVCAFALTEAARADDSAVVALSQAMGCDLTDMQTDFMATPGANDWRLVHYDKTAITPIDVLMAAYCDEPAAPVVEPAGLEKWRDATVHAGFDPEADDMLAPVVITLGPSSKAGAGKWKSTTMTRAQVFELFTRHQTSEFKDGPAAVLGDVEGSRGADNVRSLSFVGLDVDNGFAGDEIARRITDAGLSAVLASTHSHLKTTTTEAHKGFVDWAAEHFPGRELDDEIMRGRMGWKGYDQAIVDSMTFDIVEAGQNRDGSPKLKVNIDHAPIPKWRVIVPLSAPFVIAENGATQDDGVEAWRAVPRALARMLGGLPIDDTGCDANRLFYLPSHAAGAEWRIDVFGGDLLDWRAVVEADHAGEPAVEPRARKRGAASAATGPLDERWVAKNGEKLLIVDLIRKFNDPRAAARDRLIRGKDAEDKVHILCPFEDDHSKTTARDKGCFVQNPGVSHKAKGFVISCSHNACQKHDRLAHLNKMVANKWFAAEDVEAACNMVIEDEAPADDDVDVEAALAEYAGGGGQTRPAPKTKPATTTGYPLPKAAGKFELTEVDGRQFFAFPPDDEGKGGGLAFSRWSLVGGAVHPDRAGLRDLEIAFENEDGAREVFRIPADKAATKAFAIGVMRGQGIAFGSAAGEIAAHRILMMSQPTNQVIRDRTGWLEDGMFMLPTGAVNGTPDGADVRLSDIVRIKAPATAGSLDGWKAGAAEACRSDSLSLKVALLAGLAGPGVALTGQGTLVINFAGKSSQGKTFRQQVGVSASGPVKPGVGQLQSANSTQNAMEIPLERGSGSITAFDELHLTSAKIAQNLIFIASGQQGRNRATNTGGQGTVRSWRGGVVTLSSEVGLAQRLQQEGERLAGGATVRAIEVNAAEGRLDNKAYAKVATMLTNYGHALPVVVEALRDGGYVESPELLAKRVAKVVEDLGVDPADAMAYRSATGLAYLVVAGDIAVEMGLLPKTFQPIQVGREVWGAMVSGTLSAEDPVDGAIARLFENLNTRKGEVYNPSEGREPFREIAAAVGKHGTEDVYVLRHSLLAEWSGGAADVRDLKRALLDRGIAIPYERPKAGGGKSAGAVWDQWKQPIGKTPCLILRSSFIVGDPGKAEGSAII